ncbi:hypothetical protein MRX96_049102 [Rhipicephalus microplus]
MTSHFLHYRVPPSSAHLSRLEECPFAGKPGRSSLREWLADKAVHSALEGSSHRRVLDGFAERAAGHIRCCPKPKDTSFSPADIRYRQRASTGGAVIRIHVRNPLFKHFSAGGVRGHLDVLGQ